VSSDARSSSMSRFAGDRITRRCALYMRSTRHAPLPMCSASDAICPVRGSILSTCVATLLRVPSVFLRVPSVAEGDRRS
jgi:hypothetical protein